MNARPLTYSLSLYPYLFCQRKYFQFTQNKRNNDKQYAVCVYVGIFVYIYAQTFTVMLDWDWIFFFCFAFVLAMHFSRSTMNSMQYMLNNTAANSSMNYSKLSCASVSLTSSVELFKGCIFLIRLCALWL